jgi:hypothetical protein
MNLDWKWKEITHRKGSYVRGDEVVVTGLNVAPKRRGQELRQTPINRTGGVIWHWRLLYCSSISTPKHQRALTTRVYVRGGYCATSKNDYHRARRKLPVQSLGSRCSQPLFLCVSSPPPPPPEGGISLFPLSPIAILSLCVAFSS